MPRGLSYGVLLIAPSSPNTLYMSGYCSEGYIVYKSADGGATWMKLDVPGDPYTRLLGIDRQGALYVWVWSQKQFATSQDGGATWTTLTTNGLGDQIMNLAIDPLDSNHLFAGTYGSGLYEIRLASQE